jgi:ParB family chromosome partitioning protein
MTGRGLESLIPKKNFHNSTAPHPAPTVSAAPERFIPPPTPGPASFSAIDPVSPPMPTIRDSRSKEKGDSIFQIEVDKIEPNPYQPRRFFQAEELQELAESIREHGVLQPIVVTKKILEAESGARVIYELVAGERRLRASRLAGLERIPAIIRSSIPPKQAQLELALIENIQRSNLNPLESARAYARLQEEFNLTQREIAVRVGKSREAVANALRLLNLSTEAQEALEMGKISESQARAILSVNSSQEQHQALEKILSGSVSGRELHRESRVKAETPTDPESRYWQKKLEEYFSAPVLVSKKGNKRQVTLRFFSEEDWQGALKRLFGADSISDF